MLGAARIIAGSHTTVLLGLAMTASMGALTAYIATSELIITEVLGLDGWFPVVFGAMAVGMGVASFVNSRLVHRFGMWAVLSRALVSYVIIGLTLLATCLATDGIPPTWLALTLLALLLANHSLLIPTMNSAAMEPMGAVAGTASAVLGAVTVAGGAIIGGIVDSAFDGTLQPLAWCFGISGVIALVCFSAAHRRRPDVRPYAPVLAATD